MDEKDLLIAQLRKENAALRQMIEDLQKQVKNLTEAVLLLRKGFLQRLSLNLNPLPFSQYYSHSFQ